MQEDFAYTFLLHVLLFQIVRFMHFDIIPFHSVLILWTFTLVSYVAGWSRYVLIPSLTLNDETSIKKEMVLSSAPSFAKQINHPLLHFPKSEINRL